jgi:hypothetical protein
LETPNNNAEALALLWNHLPDELYHRIESINPQDIDAFFEAVRNCYLKRKPVTFTYSNNNITTALSNVVAKPALPQQNVDLEKIEFIAMHLGYPEEAPRDFDSMYKFIDVEMFKQGYNMRRESRSVNAMKKKTKKPKKGVRHCSQCGSTKHTKTNCNSKRKSKKFNYGNKSESESSEDEDSESEDSEPESEESSSSEEDEPKHFNAGKKKNW